VGDGDQTKARNVGEHDHHEVVDYSFSVTINVEGARDEARLKKLIDAEFEKLYAAVQQKKKK
jgi:5S rRNA maturation endonuclease (ribonuclease M5)